MVRECRAAGVSIAWLLGLPGLALSSACVEFDYDPTGTAFRCEGSGLCPTGYSCVSGRCVTSLPADFTDDGAGFAAGSFSGTFQSADHVRLVAGSPDGEFVSRLFDSGAEGRVWSRMEWTPGAPYQLPLPDDRGQELYRADSADMSGNILLLHADLDGTLGVDAPLTDSSGRGNHPEVIGAPLVGSEGVFGGAVADSFASRLAVDLARPGAAADFSTGEDDFTWSLWISTTEACLGADSLGNDTYLGADDDRENGGAHLWFGCARAISPGCPTGGAGNGRLGGTLISDSNANDGGSYCGTGEITDGDWHHLVLTKTGHDPATIETWIDGQQDSSRQVSFKAPIIFDAGKVFNIAGEPTPRETAGTFDEIAIWRRALSPDEVRALYLRAIRQLGFQVRACEQADCADDPPFVGPGGSGDAVFVDPGAPAGAGPTVAVELEAVRGRYFQYRATFTGSDAVDGSPELHGVRLFLAP
jgi:hypothetical protein